ADVRISMTVGVVGQEVGKLATVSNEIKKEVEREVTLIERIGRISSDLTIGPDVASSGPLKANGGLSSMGCMLAGRGFVITHEKAIELGLGSVAGTERHLRPIINGRDLNQRSRNLWAIDLYGLQINEVRKDYPAIFQHLYENVKPERDVNRDRKFREEWWLFGRPRPEMRSATNGLSRFIVTTETSKHRFFTFLDSSIIPEHVLIVIATDDAFHLGVLSSKHHVLWALAAGGRLGIGNDPRYNKTRCFETFPFPEASDAQKAIIRALGEE